jgi:hypothetical protein
VHSPLQESGLYLVLFLATAKDISAQPRYYGERPPKFNAPLSLFCYNRDGFTSFEQKGKDTAPIYTLETEGALTGEIAQSSDLAMFSVSAHGNLRKKSVRR